MTETSRTDSSKRSIVKDTLEHRTSAPQAAQRKPSTPRPRPASLVDVTEYLDSLALEIDTAFDLSVANPYLNMATHLVRHHVQGRLVTGSSLVAASGVPYATGMRKLRDMLEAGLIEQRPRTKSGKTFSLHPSPAMLEQFDQLADRVRRLSIERFGGNQPEDGPQDYYYGDSYMNGQAIQPPAVLPEPLALPGGLRGLVHGDPTFMVMKDLKRQFEQVLGTDIHQRAFSIDRLRDEALRNAARRQSRYDIIAVDLPWIGEFAQKGILAPLDAIMDVTRLDPSDFHTAGWQGAHWGGRPYGVPSQTTPELLFYRTDLFAEEGLVPPSSTAEVLDVARRLHRPARGRYGIAWNAARGTALGHTFIMTCGDFGQPIVSMPRIAGGFDASRLDRGDFELRIDSDRALDAAEYLLSLMDVSPPNILSMSWYERIRPYAAGDVAMAYGYTLLAPYFELDPKSPAQGNTGFLPHPAGPLGSPIAPVGGYVLGIPSNLAPERRAAAVEALIAFTSPEAQKLYVQHGARTTPRYSVGADPDVRRLSPVFEAVDAMSWRDELQFWPRPPIPRISEVITIVGEELHDMLRGLTPPRIALKRAQHRAERALGQADG
ncbi:sugar ABC transporter substrate-binding protein [Meridianimarinicoccus roseus]|uniref:Sugar ABC transporter substrate-binding protein n=1 Tax=Meridianimarinicoccus roseus TaxID=2072018 RepID=A0A2V2LG98_9RHOB|nr:extracellular solute-binding protein [Meridianimarinicoccus roseus]PWR00943.1 sugar ABC transporter substrate-binding protein [Meridianimarinicoccus roseus]